MQYADADFHFLIVEKASRPVLSTQLTPEFFTLLWHQAQQVTYVKRQHLKLPSSVEQEKIQEAQSVPGWGHFKLSYEGPQWQYSHLPVAATTQLSQHVFYCINTIYKPNCPPALALRTSPLLQGHVAPGAWWEEKYLYNYCLFFLNNIRLR